MDIVRGKLKILPFLTVTGPLIFAGCDTVMKYTPQQLSDLTISHANGEVDPKGDPCPQALAMDEAACADMVRAQYPIVHINEGAIIAGNMAGGAAGGASSGAAAAAGSGHAGQGAALGSIGGAAGGGVASLHQIEQIYKIQVLRQGEHYILCLEKHGHVLNGEPDELGTEQLIRTIDTPGFHL